MQRQSAEDLWVLLADGLVAIDESYPQPYPEPIDLWLKRVAIAVTTEEEAVG